MIRTECDMCGTRLMYGMIGFEGRFIIDTVQDDSDVHTCFQCTIRMRDFIRSCREARG